MKKGFYLRLAGTNIRNNRRIYVPYILTCVFTVMVYYLVKSLSVNPGLASMYGGDKVGYVLNLGTYIIGLFAVIFLFYTNSFLMKRRQKEFGIFNILGMEKKHLAIVLLAEAGMVAILSLAAGVLAGILFDKAMFLLICRMIGGEVALGFFVSGKVILQTVFWFCLIYLLICLKAVLTIQVSDPIKLLQGSSVGEKEPRAKWLLALLGAVSLGTGYGLAITIRNPLASIETFFAAVILVVIGTYLLFTAGSIAVLKILRRNQKFYYQPEHFISVSGMMYRMKRNAVGLANICILSTMVLVMLSTTTSLVLGIEDIIRSRVPNDLGIYCQETDDAKREALFRSADALCREHGISVKDRMEYRYVAFSACQRGNEFETDESKMDIVKEYNMLRTMVFIPLSDYQTLSDENQELTGNEVLFYSDQIAYEEETLKLLGQEYLIEEHAEAFAMPGISSSVTSYYLVVTDEVFERLMRDGREQLGEFCRIDAYYGMDLEAEKEEQQALAENISETISREGYQGYLETRIDRRQSFLSLYGGLLFLGLFLGLLFTMAAVLIIYYKQISEGYEDRERFVIMQKVGMTQAEVRKTVRSQVLTVFFLPLIAAGIHVAAAFPLIRLLLALLAMTNVKLYLLCTAAAFLAFAALYVMIYRLTARTYYKIVRWN